MVSTNRMSVKFYNTPACATVTVSDATVFSSDSSRWSPTNWLFGSDRSPCPSLQRHNSTSIEVRATSNSSDGQQWAAIQKQRNPFIRRIWPLRLDGETISSLQCNGYNLPLRDPVAARWSQLGVANAWCWVKSFRVRILGLHSEIRPETELFLKWIQLCESKPVMGRVELTRFDLLLMEVKAGQIGF